MMLDISFGELVLIAAVALIVIGPEQLPKVAKTVGHFVGKLQDMLSAVKESIGQELELEKLESVKKEAESLSISVQNTVENELSTIENNLKFPESSLLPKTKEKLEDGHL